VQWLAKSGQDVILAVHGKRSKLLSVNTVKILEEARLDSKGAATVGGQIVGVSLAVN
jgi:hypothetical protein